MDYRELLKKYMKHVEEAEGSTFLPSAEWMGFTKEEIEELTRLDREVFVRINAEAGDLIFLQ